MLACGKSISPFLFNPTTKPGRRAAPQCAKAQNRLALASTSSFCIAIASVRGSSSKSLKNENKTQQYHISLSHRHFVGQNVMLRDHIYQNVVHNRTIKTERKMSCVVNVVSINVVQKSSHRLLRRSQGIWRKPRDWSLLNTVERIE